MSALRSCLTVRVCAQVRMKELEEALEQEREAHSRVSSCTPCVCGPTLQCLYVTATVFCPNSLALTATTTAAAAAAAADSRRTDARWSCLRQTEIGARTRRLTCGLDAMRCNVLVTPDRLH